MATPKSPKPPKKASSSSATGVTPKKQNNTGKVVDKSTPAPQKKPVTRPDVKNTHEYLDSVEPKDIPDEMGKLTKDLDKALADKDYSRATQLKDAKAGLQDKAAQAGLKVKDFAPGTLGPSLPQVEAMGAAMSAMDGDALGKKMFSKAFANIKANAKPGTKPDPKPTEAPKTQTAPPAKPPGGHSNSKKRRPKHKCELMPYKDMICDGEKHHVVPHWTTRTGNAKTKLDASKQIPGTPSYDDAPAICLSKDEHKGIHKTVDDKIQTAGKGGTVSAGEVKKISSDEAAKKSGCNPKNINKQLKNKFKAPDDAPMRAVKDARQMTPELIQTLKPEIIK